MKKIPITFIPAAIEFIDSLAPKAQQKIVYNINRISNGIQDPDLFSKLGDTDIWEFKTLFNGKKYRLLAFWDNTSTSIIIVTHGFVKKTRKTPHKEIERAQALRTEYYNDKDE